jgi:predicted NAD/FAD-binding protein
VKRIAVIGSGIAGLSAGYYLSRKHEVFLFEKETRLGGQTHTVTVDSSVGPLAVDTGFVAHNDSTYPNLIQLLEEMEIPRIDSDMSFAVSCRKTGYEYSSREVRGFFAQKRNVLSARPSKLLGEIKRFNREAIEALARPTWESLKLGDFLDEKRFSQEFRELYLVPMAAVWSCAPRAVNEFPAATLLRFFDNQFAEASQLVTNSNVMPGKRKAGDAGLPATAGGIRQDRQHRMFEAVGLAHYDEFFQACDRLPAPDGSMLMQTITMPDQELKEYRLRVDWIQAYIFPGSELGVCG